jgi:hypothetical protein
MVATSPVTRESTKETVKTIARGMPGVPGVTVVTCSCAFLFCTRGYGRIQRPAFPAPSDFRWREIHWQNSGTRRENAKVCLGLGQRHCEERSDEAIHSIILAARWIASLTLAMTNSTFLAV